MAPKNPSNRLTWGNGSILDLPNLVTCSPVGSRKTISGKRR